MTKSFDLKISKTRRLLPAVVLVGLSALSVAACNTVDGAGQDIENTGEAIQDSADDND